MRPLNRPAHRVGADESTDQLVDMLDELGFQPEQLEPDDAGEKQLGLRHCPFLELAETSTDVVCPIHLGLMQGALEAWDAPVTVDRLDSFAQPDLCVAHLKSMEFDGAEPVPNGVRIEQSSADPVPVEGTTG